VPPAEVSDFRSLTGRGVMGTIVGKRGALGNSRLLQDLGIEARPLAAQAEALRAEGQTVMFLVVDDQVVGLLGVADPISRAPRRRFACCTLRAARDHADR